MKLQGLNSRGSVEQVMKDVKSQASKNAATGKQGGLNAEIQSRIGHQLRAMYDDVVRQGVPDRFAELIRKLDVPEPDPQVGDTGDRTRMTGGSNASHRCPSRRHPGVGASACARSPSRFPATATAPTIWCRRRCCARSPISTRSSPAPTCRRGCSRSCATCSAPTIASGGARWRTPTAAMPRR